MSPALAQAAVVLVAFAEPGFPAVDAPRALPAIPAVEATTVAALDSLLRQPGAVLVWRHGSTFPLDAWPAIRGFLESGGDLVYLGGVPFGRPVGGPPGDRRAEPATLAYVEYLRLTQTYAQDAGGSVLTLPGQNGPRWTVPDGARVWSFEPALAGPPVDPGEEGSPGRRDGTVRGLGMLYRPGEDRFPFAAAGLVVDWADGPFAGGRWVLRPLDAPLERRELAVLLEALRRPPGSLRAAPAYATFHDGETPRVVLTRAGHTVTGGAAAAVTVAVTDADGRPVGRAMDLRVEDSTDVPLPAVRAPGLYRVRARDADGREATTGFWVFDAALFGSGDRLTFDAHTLRRNGRPEPVVGTTVMSRTVHRRFLDEPDAAVWDDTFAELASLGVNLVRTGVWSGWGRIVSPDGGVDEAWLRALEAYYLSARRHGIPILFTFFAFMPPWGDSPYFDPVSLARQRAYVGGVARRFAGAREMLWDLINEPSFASPRHVWLTRPSGSPAEEAAFRAWLARAYPGDGTSDTAWTAVVRRRWRLRADEPVTLPAEADFDDAQVFARRRPYRARDYIRFAQDAFRDWAVDLRRVIRAAGSDAAVTVGQDEGGLYDRPSPLYHATALDFASVHTWWFNDALWWDGVLSRPAGVPLLVSETGIMQRERLSGETVRALDDRARLLSRKLAYAFAAGAFGAVEWVYDVNPYMDSDNEVAIGLRRADGSYTPEHAVLVRYARFVRRSGARFDGPAPPDVVVLLPSADQYSPRGLGAEASRRALAILGGLGIRPLVVPEYDLARLPERPPLIVLPATRGLADSAWQAVRLAVERGSVLLASGYLEADDAGLPAHRLGSTPRPLAPSEVLAAPGLPAARLTYPLRIVESVMAAAGESREIPTGAGVVLHHPVPLEWADAGPLQDSIYARALARAGVEEPGPAPSEPAPGVFVSATRFADGALVVVVNEGADDRAITLPVRGGRAATVTVRARDAVMLWVARDGTVPDATEPGAVRVASGR